VREKIFLPSILPLFLFFSPADLGLEPFPERIQNAKVQSTRCQFGSGKHWR
jgi:hypothetical protein